MAEAPDSETRLPGDDSARLDDCVKRFDDAWQTGQRPSIEDYLPEDVRDRQAVLPKLVHVDLERRLKAGEPVRVEGYLQQYAALAGDDEAVLGLIVHEYKVRRSQETGLTIAECVRRFPRYELRLLGLFGSEETRTPGALPQSGQPATREPIAPAAGRPDSIGKYQVIEGLGRGGQADVFRAVHPHLPGRDVVIKWFHQSLTDQGQTDLFEEGRVLASLDDPGIARIYDVDVHQSRPFMVLEHIAGCTLRDLLQQRQFSAREAAGLVAELARTLSRVHRQGVWHRDLKPANILIHDAGRPRLLDFGLAWMNRTWEQPDRREGDVSGTFAYMSPEQANGETGRIGPATDIFGLGAILYHLLTGRPPYEDADPMVVWEQARKAEVLPPRRLNPNLPRALARICLKALAADPDQRYKSAGDLERALRGFLRRGRVAAAAASGLLLSALVAIGVAYWPVPARHTDPGSAAPDAPAPFKGDLDVLVWESSSRDQDKFVPAARRQNIRLPQAVPLSRRDWLRIEARLNRPAYLYLIWLDTEGKATPIFPWQDSWDRRPAREQPRDRLSLPEKAGELAPLAPGPAGLETVLLLIRETPLTDADHAALPGLFAGLPRALVPDLRAAAWFEGGDLVTPQREPDRGPIQIGKAQAGADPVLRLQALLQTKLRPLFPYSRAVCFGNTGQGP
jgi:serine/threonine protein kinase